MKFKCNGTCECLEYCQAHIKSSVPVSYAISSCFLKLSLFSLVFLTHCSTLLKNPVMWGWGWCPPALVCASLSFHPFAPSILYLKTPKEEPGKPGKERTQLGRVRIYLMVREKGKRLFLFAPGSSVSRMVHHPIGM